MYPWYKNLICTLVFTLNISPTERLFALRLRLIVAAIDATAAVDATIDAMDDALSVDAAN